ncbi:MAG: hypothetical protein RLZZ214_1890 [Verrucomicrobiota bacterium]
MATDFIYALRMRATFPAGLFLSALLVGSLSAAPLRIMPVGDSITAGYTDNAPANYTGNPALYWTVPFEFGYRRQLYQLLENAGYDFVFVGASQEPFVSAYGDPTHGGTVSPTFDLRPIGQNGHRGYGGIRINQIDDNIVSYLNTDNPDIILLMIGINGMDSGSPAELATLVDMILATKPNAHLILAQITPMSSNVTYAQKNADLVAYNTYIRETLVPNLQAQGKKISTINQYRNFLTNPDNPASDINASLYSNGINHPTNPAYDTMADIWFAGIQAVVPAPASPVLSESMFLPSISQGTTIGTFTTTPPPVPESFSYSFTTGPGDTDNSKFTISSNQLQAGTHNYGADPAGTTYSIRVKATGGTTGQVGNETFLLTTISLDSDNDQHPDSWEMANAGNLTDLTQTGDFDQDGLSDAAEYQLSLGAYPNINPVKSDTDGDGLLDGAEINGAGQRPPTNPTLTDTDGDSACDLNEDNTGTYVNILRTGTNPTVADSDGDGVIDGAEILQNTNPASAASPGPPEVVTNSNATLGTVYAGDVSAIDLLQGLTGTNVVHSGWNYVNGATPLKLNDGLHGLHGTNPVEGGWSLPGSIITYTLPPGQGAGWDLTGITTIADWSGGGFGNQRYEVAVRRLGETAFTLLATVDLEPFNTTGVGGSKVQITPASAKLAGGVEQIRFTMLTTAGNAGRAVYREFDVFGTTSAIPPTEILNLAPPATGKPQSSIIWRSLPQMTYRVESSENLTAWNVLDAAYPSGGVTTTFSKSASLATQPREFFRVCVNP